jgi:hypothetical protein
MLVVAWWRRHSNGDDGDRKVITQAALHVTDANAKVFFEALQGAMKKSKDVETVGGAAYLVSSPLQILPTRLLHLNNVVPSDPLIRSCSFKADPLLFEPVRMLRVSLVCQDGDREVAWIPRREMEQLLEEALGRVCLRVALLDNEVGVSVGSCVD